jgi:hypothetical protein
MRHWLPPFATGLLTAAVLAAAAWFVPAFLPQSVPEAMLQPSYQMEELVARFVPEVGAAMQRALAAAAVAALAGFVVLAAVHLLARPTGPGEASSSWRRALWFVLLVAVFAAAAGAGYYFLGVSVTTTENAAATQWSAGLGGAASLLFWLLSLLGTERMLRPAVPLATLVCPT